jgi:hypothetical protein
MALPLLTLSLDIGGWSASHPGCFIPKGNRLWYTLDRRLGGSKSWSGSSGEENNLDCAGI